MEQIKESYDRYGEYLAKGMEMGRNLVLIGFMGTGKSSVGLRLAQKMKRTFVDMDREIELISGMSIYRYI